MYLPATFALLGLLTGAVLLLRLLWWRLPEWLRRSVLGIAIAMVLIRILFIGLQWSMTSTRLNAVVAWASIAGYQILLARFSLMRPRWLTSISAVILLAPLIGSTMITPLTRIFDWTAADISPLGGPYLLEKSPWDTDSTGNPGVDLYVFYRPPFAPFLRHMSQRAAFGHDACKYDASSVQINLDAHTAHFHCPAKAESDSPIDLILPLH
jgi:hypothetical protein